MFGPGEYVPDPTEGIVDVKDLPAPQLVLYRRNQKSTPCPRCDHLASRHTSGQRTLHDLGDVYTGRPVDADRKFKRPFGATTPAAPPSIPRQRPRLAHGSCGAPSAARSKAQRGVARLSLVLDRRRRMG